MGIDPSELYQLTLDEFKLVNPDVRYLPQDMVKLRYDAEEKYREDSINQVKEERQNIIEAEEKKNEEKTQNNEGDKKNDELGQKMEKIKEDEQLALEKIKKRQKIDIEAMIENQINTEMMNKMNLEKERRQKEKEKQQ